MFNTSCPQGDGINRWHDAIACVWLNNTSSFWQGNSGSRANHWWSKFASEVAYVCDTVFGTVDISNLASWYYNQGGTNHTGGGYWGNKVHQCSGWSGDHTYAQSGCGITSMAMIARYYNKKIDPYQMGNEFCRLTGSLAVGPGSVATVAEKILNMDITTINNPTFVQITSALSHGPLLARGDPLFGSSGPHFAVIAGVDGDNLIVNDPSSSRRGKSGRVVPPSQQGNLLYIIYFRK